MMKYSLAAKVTAIMLCVVTMIGVVGSVLLCVLLGSLGVYTSSYQAIVQTRSLGILEGWCHSALATYMETGADNARYIYDYKNFYFTIADEEGNILVSTLPEDYLPEEDSRYVISGSAEVIYDNSSLNSYFIQYNYDYNSINYQSESHHFSHWYDGGREAETAADTAVTTVPEDEPMEPLEDSTQQPVKITDPTPVGKTYIITGHVPHDMQYIDQIYLLHTWLRTGYTWRYILPVVGILCLLGNIILYIYLLCAAGHHPHREEAVANIFDRIPLDLYTVGIGLLIALSVELFPYGSNDVISVAYIATGALAGYLLFLQYTMSFATRVKVGTVFRGTIIWRMCAFLWKILSRIGHALLLVLTNLTLLSGTIFLLVLSFIWSLFAVLLIDSHDGFGYFLWIVGWFMVVGGAFYLTFCLHRLKKGGEHIAAGNLSHQIHLSGLFGPLRSHAQTLNHISDGMSRAVEDRLKSERFRTELITNVSHDLKTPLTSIVNYIDLLKKENIDSPTAAEYIEVLDRQSARLKKLTEDLVEASKASTGNLEVVPVACELGEFLSQCAGEYREKLEQNQLELIVSQPEWPVSIYADGRHLWRVFDNLLNNVCKYAQPGTRVYLNLEVLNKKAVIIFRNTSRYALNVSGEELMERFVRGDSSRHTEGSGLGLSIARSLTELQQGTMDIYVDGDLFKVILTFTIMGNPPTHLPEQYHGNTESDQ